MKKDGYIPTDEEPEPMDFAWFTFYGLKMGLSIDSIRHMRMGQWLDLFEIFKQAHNMEMERKIYVKPKPSSLLTL